MYRGLVVKIDAGVKDVGSGASEVVAYWRRNMGIRKYFIQVYISA
jgi:hypothetical protein